MSFIDLEKRDEKFRLFIIIINFQELLINIKVETRIIDL